MVAKSSLGTLLLSPLKENGKFVFLNREIKVNGKVSKGDYIKIFVDSYEVAEGQYFLQGNNPPYAKLMVRGKPSDQEFSPEIKSVKALYDMASEHYKNLYYFGVIKN